MRVVDGVQYKRRGSNGEQSECTISPELSSLRDDHLCTNR